MAEYQIMLGDKAIGTAQVIREGLYYRIRCQCELSGETIFRVVVRCAQQEENLGILAPNGSRFGLETRLAAKKLGKPPFRFSVVPKERSVKGCFVPLSAEEPFRYIARLKDAYLENRNGRIGIVIKEPDCG